MAELTPFAIKARYGAYKKRLSEIVNRKKAKEILTQTEVFFQWLLKLGK